MNEETKGGRLVHGEKERRKEKVGLRRRGHRENRVERRLLLLG